MRQPLEDGELTISRAAASLTFPAKVMLVGAMNPCPCGYYGAMEKRCSCTPPMIERYRSRISGPLLDRIDLHIEVPAVTYAELRSERNGLDSAGMREQVSRARSLQQERFAKTQVTVNAHMNPRLIKKHCTLTQDAEQIFKAAMSNLHFSARAYSRILKVARTIADLAKSENIETDHISEAVQYRSLDRKVEAF